MIYVVMFLAYFVLFYSIYRVFFWFKGRKKSESLYKVTEVILMEKIAKINSRKIGIDKIISLVCINNALIFTIVLMGTMWINNFILRVLAMFLLLFPIDYLLYYFTGKLLKNKEKDKNV